MKKLIPTILIGLSTTTVLAQGKTQDTSWTKNDAVLYGTKSEKVYQEAIENQSRHHFLCRYVGFKQYYVNDLTAYLQLNRNFTIDDTPEKPGYDVYVLSKNGVHIGNMKVPKMYLTFGVNKQGRITSGKISSGLIADMVDLFLNYWPQDATYASAEQLKPGVAAIKHCYGDLISFMWYDTKAVITITKDPDVNMPVPELAASK